MINKINSDARVGLFQKIRKTKLLESLDISKSSKIPDKQTAGHISLISKLVGHQSLMIQGDGQNIGHHRPVSRIANMPDREIGRAHV